jgi:anti-sigma-K factor RskA
MEHAEYQELLALEAVDALDGRDAQMMRAHLESCPSCRGELAELRDAAALLAHAAPPAAPGNEVRERIMRDIQSQSRPTPIQAQNVVPFSQALSAAWPNVLRLAAALAFVALLLGIVMLWRRDAASRREIAELARQLNRQQRELQVERDNMAKQTEALALLNSPDARKIALAGTPTAQTARAMFFYDEKSRHGMLMIEGLPPTAPDKAYEVWFIPKGRSPMPGRTFTVDATGRAMISDNLPREAGDSMVVAITLEPKSGSAVPTMPIYLASPAS